MLAVSWWPGLWYPLGDSSEGRILARLGIQARNFWEMGAIASGWGTNLQPYAETYAHHPPLINMAQIGVFAIAGEGEAQLRIFGFFAGFLTLWALLALLRQLGVGWSSALIVVGALSTTTFFWAFGRLGGGFSMAVAFLASVAYLRNHEDFPGWTVYLAAGLGAASVLLAWPAAAIAGLGGIWLLAGRGWDRATRTVAIAGVIAATALAVWILSATDVTELADQARSRSNTEAFSFGEFLEKQWSYATRLLPAWFLWLAPAALVAGLFDRRTRAVVGLSVLVAIAWTFGPQEGAFNHEFWNLNWFLPITVGGGALIDMGIKLLRSWHRLSVYVAIVALGLFVALALLGRIGTTAFRGGADAGELLDTVDPPPSQTTVWVASNIAAPRWASWYWDLPVTRIGVADSSEVPPNDLVLVRVADVPEWTADDAGASSRGGYALIPGSSLESGG